MSRATPRRRAELTFQANRSAGRHGWLRLTPAYARRVVAELLDAHAGERVLDPFSGTGTTALCAAERGRHGTGVELNPFLVELGRLKLRRFARATPRRTTEAAERVLEAVAAKDAVRAPAPPIHNIARWWAAPVLDWLQRLRAAVDAEKGVARELLGVAFCRTMIALSGAAFDHVSMSFKEPALPADVEAAGAERFRADVEAVRAGAAENPPGRGALLRGDARTLAPLEGEHDLVVTSPPYPNRVSYVRELRPYMYWTGHLHEAREAGELDWRAIGGAWGVATSRLASWTPRAAAARPSALEALLPRVREAHPKNGPLLAAYVDRYFEDMATHLDALRPHVRRGGSLHYVIGNASFYGELVPAEALLAELMERAGFVAPEVELLRKRNSKKELFEFVVHARG